MTRFTVQPLISVGVQLLGLDRESRRRLASWLAA
jgi:hypothetical protein